MEKWIDSNNEYELLGTIYTGDKFIIYRANNIKKNRPVYLKAIKAMYPDLRDLAQLEREYELISQLSVPEIIKCYGIARYEHKLALVLEEVTQGMSLSQYLEFKRISLEEFLKIAIQITQGLMALHEKHIIHKDIKPQNIIISQKYKKIKIIDFGMSTQLSRESPQVTGHNLLEGSLPYISPEQTGQLNIQLDYRTDFYSLGMTLYELITQELPFSAENKQEWVKLHITQRPKPPHLINKDIPIIISDIIMRLIHKTPDERYQSYFSLQNDLEKCLHQLQVNEVIEPFNIAENDISDRFRIATEVVGRSDEFSLLESVYKKTATGSRELFLVSGYAGVGKSTLVNELKSLVITNNGYYALGKADQYNQHIPYYSLHEALNELINQLLYQSHDVLNTIIDEFNQALSPNTQLIIDLVPKFKIIVGEQPAVAELDYEQAMYRFQYTLKSFIKVIAKKEHPLVLFLDDLHWSDIPTINLIKQLLQDRDIEALLLIGAYRDNEVDDKHPLYIVINQIKQINVISELNLQPLTLDGVVKIISHILHCPLDKAKELAELIFHKTHGNPFFTNELLKQLHLDGHINFNYQNGRWEWDINKIKKVNISENVLTFLMDNLTNLESNTLKLLELAACIGIYFDLQLLASVAKEEVLKVAAALWKAAEIGIINPQSGDYEFAKKLSFTPVQNNRSGFSAQYRFQHDRLQQAAYEMIGSEQRAKNHLAIARNMLTYYDKIKTEEEVEMIANHFNRSITLLESNAEKLQIAKLNLRAGRKAKDAIAYDDAYLFLESGIDLLSEKSWHDEPNLCFNLHKEFSKCAHLLGKFDQAKRTSYMLLKRAETDLEKAKIYRGLAIQYTINGEQQKAVEAALKGLIQLGVEIKSKLNKFHILKEVLRIKLRLGFKTIDSLIDLPLMTNERYICIMQLLLTIGPPSYIIGNENLFTLATLKQVSISIRHGNCKESANAYAFYGVLLNGIFNKYSDAYEFGKLAVRLNEKKLNDPVLRCSIIHLYTAFILPWNVHWRCLYSSYAKAIDAGLKSGDLLYVSYACALNLVQSSQFNLTEATHLAEKYIQLVSSTKYKGPIMVAELLQQFRLSLVDRSNQRYFAINSKREEFYYQTFKDDKFHSGLAIFLISKIEDCYLFEEFEQACNLIEETESHLNAILAMHLTEEFFFFAYLSLAQHFREFSHSEQTMYRKKMKTYFKKISRWARHSELNFLHHKYILLGERYRLKKKATKALKYYKKAIQLARQNEYLRYEAIACQLAANLEEKFFLRAKAENYLHAAHYAYIKLGYAAKIKLLEEKYPNLKQSTDSTTISFD